MRVLLLFLCIIFFFSGSQAQQSSETDTPKLVLGIVVSGMRYDYLKRYSELFGEGGFKRLMSEGINCRNAHHDYMLSEPSSGFATISTGAFPSAHGIVSDFWYDRLRDEIIYSVSDEKARTLGGSYGEGQFSPSRLLLNTLSDELKISNLFESKVISVSLDPRASVLMGGHSADASYWYDPSNGNMITSDHYLDSLPAWVEEFNRKGLADIYLGKTWTTFFPDSVYTRSLPDENLYETGLGEQKTFPYSLSEISTRSRNRIDYGLLRYTPYSNNYTLDFAISAIMQENLGKDDTTDWLFLNFSASGYAGERFSSLSVEMEDIYIRLDRDIEHLLNYLDETIGLENTLVYLTADNALSHEPTWLNEQRIPSGYFNYNLAISLLKTYLNVIYGTGDWVKFYYAKQIYLNQLLIDDAGLSYEDIQDRVSRFMVQFEGVVNVVTSESLLKNNYSSGTLMKMQRAFNQKRSGDVLLHLNPGWMEKNVDRKISSSFHYESHVPLMFFGWSVEPGEVTGRVSVTDIMPTLAFLLDITVPSGMSGNVIHEIVE